MFRRSGGMNREEFSSLMYKRNLETATKLTPMDDELDDGVDLEPDGKEFYIQYDDEEKEYLDK